MHESADLLVVDQLSYSYGDRVAVKSASLTCRRAEILGLLGPNGAGKTTLLSCIAGLLQGFEGQLMVDGAAFRPAEDVAGRARLGLVPQELALEDEDAARLRDAARAHHQSAGRSRSKPLRTWCSGKAKHRYTLYLDRSNAALTLSRRRLLRQNDNAQAR